MNPENCETSKGFHAVIYYMRHSAKTFSKSTHLKKFTFEKITLEKDTLMQIFHFFTVPYYYQNNMQNLKV